MPEMVRPQETETGDLAAENVLPQTPEISTEAAAETLPETAPAVQGGTERTESQSVVKPEGEINVADVADEPLYTPQQAAKLADEVMGIGE